MRQVLTKTAGADHRCCGRRSERNRYLFAEAFPYQAGPRFLIFDRDSKYGFETPIAVRSMGLIPVRTSCESPWQNALDSIVAVSFGMLLLECFSLLLSFGF